MASIHTAAVDFDWFELPADAAARNEQFLHAAFDHSSAESFRVAPPEFDPLPVRTYTREPALDDANLFTDLDSEHPQRRVAAARAALVHDVPLSQNQQNKLLCNTVPDAIWFGTEISLRDKGLPSIDIAVDLLGQQDDYLIGIGDHLFDRANIHVDALCDYLVQQPRVSQKTAVAANKIAEID